MTNENTKQDAPNAEDFLNGNYLKKEDVKQPMTVTLTDVWSETVLNSGRKKLVVSLQEFEKPLILNKTNIRRLSRIFGTGSTHFWRGPVTLYVEASVEYGGRVVGGLRVKPAVLQAETEAPRFEQQQYPIGAAADVQLRSSEADSF